MFSGIGGFELGLKQSNLEHQLIGFSEIDKYAISIFEEKFQGVKNYGNATTIRGDELPDFDLLVGGFPCQAFSVAGLQRGFDDTRGTLFFDIARILKDKRPRYLVLENVKGLLSHDKGKTFQTILRVLSDLGYGIEWQVLNSKDFGVPQNRERVFIVGHLGGRGGRQIFPITGEGKPSIRKHVDYEVRPVLTPDRAKKRQNGRRFKDDGEPSFTLTGQDIHGVMLKEITKGQSQGQRIYDSSGLATTLASQAGGLGAKTGLYKVETTAQKVKVRKHEVDVDKLCKLLRESKKISNKEIAENLDVPITMVEHWFRTDASFSIPPAETWFKLKNLLNITTNEFDLPITEFIEKDNVFDTSNRVYDSRGISPTLTAAGAETGLYKIGNVNPSKKGQSGNVYSDEGIFPTLSAGGSNPSRERDVGYSSGSILTHTRIRRLIPLECERLQGFPDNWTEGLSDTQRYKTLGNAVTVNVVETVMNSIANLEEIR